MGMLFDRLVEARQINSDFLKPDYKKLFNPFLLPNMEEAVERISSAIKKQEKILIYGDYDADGVTASIVMEQALRLAGARACDIDIMLPDRFADGYGMSPKIVTKVKKDGINLVITVDCGSSNAEIVEKLRENNIDTIVTDHHECPDNLPDAVAVVNPKRKDFDGFRDLAGVGVAFKIASALVKKGLIPDGQEKWLLDLVLIGTICDSMPLIGENRILCFYGLKVFEQTKRPGLKELIRTAGVKKIDSDAIGFQIGPRINAAGRIKSANIALDLLRVKSRSDAVQLAIKMEDLNKKRKLEQNTALNEIKKRGISNEPVIVEVGKWHEGILGIVAGQLVEEYRKPAFVLSEVSEGIIKGSGRSFGEFSLAEALKNCKESILQGGGHNFAAGVRIESGKVSDFEKQINEYYKSLKLSEQDRFLYIHEDLEVSSLNDFSLDFIDELKQLEPFGEANFEPIFRLKDVEIIENRKMGIDAKHLSLSVKGNDEKIFRLVAFFAPDEWFSYEPGEKHDILIHVLENEWNGTRSVEGRILEIF